MPSTPNGVLPAPPIHGTVALMQTTLAAFAPRHKPPPLKPLQIAGLLVVPLVIIIIFVAARLLTRDSDANRRRRLERAGDWNRAVRGWDGLKAEEPREAPEPKETREAPAAPAPVAQPGEDGRLSLEDFRALPTAERNRLLAGVRGRRL